MKTIHLVSHTHWDREWERPYQQTRFHLVQTIDRLLALLDSDPLYCHFMLDGQNIILEDYLEIRPEKKETITKLIQSGRLIIGPWYILSDQFLVSPEATVRNLLEGRRISRQFGESLPIGYVPDPFGQIGQLPQILNGFGIENACVWRGLADEPCELWWQSPDGSRVLLSFLRESYNNAANLPMERVEDFTAEIKRLAQTLEPFSKVDDILLMQGGDHTQPSVLTSRNIEHANNHLKGYQVVHSTLKDYFTALRAALDEDIKLATISGELRSSKHSPILPGVLSTRMWIKQRNHENENLLEHWGEPFSAWARLVSARDSQSNPDLNDYQAHIRYAWKLLMQCQPHDSICGSSIDQVHEEMHPRFAQVHQIGSAVVEQSLEIISSAADTRFPGPSGQTLSPLAITVFNPSSYKRSDRVSLQYAFPLSVSDVDIIDDKNQIIPHQFEGKAGAELLNASFSKHDFIKAVGLMDNGQVAGLVLKEAAVTLEANNEVLIEAVMASGDNDEPNMEAFARAKNKVEEYLSNPNIHLFKVHAVDIPSGALTFMAPEVPGMGYRTFWVRPCPPPAAVPPAAAALILLAHQAKQNVSGFFKQLNPVNRPPDLAHPTNDTSKNQINNEFFAVQVDLQNGALILTDLRTHLVYPGLNRFVDGGDCGDEYNYCPPQQDSLISPELVSVKAVNGMVESVLEINLALTVPESISIDRKLRSLKMKKMAISTRVLLMHGVPRLEIHTSVNNTAEDHRLRVHFPAPFGVSLAQHGGHFEIVQRPIGYPRFDQTWAEQPRPEVPQRLFSTLSDGTNGLTLASSGLPEIEAHAVDERNSELCLTLLRCVGWLSREDLTTRKGHAGPAIATPGAQVQGRHEFDYALIPHNGGWQNGYLQAESFDLPFRTSLTSLHGGINPPSASLLDLHGQFSLTCVKTPENGSGLIVRGYRRGYGGEITLRCLYPFARCMQVRLDETPIQEITAGPDGYYRLKARPFEIITLCFF